MSLNQKKVLLILAGGTICMQSSPNGYIPTKGLLGKCLAGHAAFDDGSHPAADEIVDERSVRRPGDASFVLPATTSGDQHAAAERSVHYTAFEFETLIDSSSADARYWNTIARCVARNYTCYDGFVVLHGTDTLAYAASALSFALHPLQKPVVLTGSQVSIFDEPSDAWDNILGALTFAGQGSVPEVCVFFHNALFRGNRAVKIHASEYAAFATPNLEPLARINGASERIAGDEEVAGGLPLAAKGARALEPVVDLDSGHVVVLRVYPGLQLETLEALVTIPGLRGLILETFGAGNMPGGQDGQLLKILSQAVERGLVVVNVSQCACTHPSISPIIQPLKPLPPLTISSVT